MRTSLQTVMIILAAAFLIAGCSSNNKGGNNSNRSPASNGGAPVGAVANSSCYNGRCLQTMPFSQIVDPQDYIYKNPNSFPYPSLRPQYQVPTHMIDLAYVNASWPLSKSFTVGDFMDYNHGRYAIFSPAVVNIMQDIQNDANTPIWITSGYRSPTHNAQVGGVAWSRHQYGDAVDFTSPSPNYSFLQSLCLKYDASFTLIYTNHIHCDWRKYPLDPAFYGSNAIHLNSLVKTTVVPPYGHYGTVKVPAQIVPLISRDGRFVRFSVTIKDVDLEGHLIYKWQVTTALEKKLASSHSSIELPIAQAPYKIDVVVGGFIHLQKTWPAQTN